MVETWKQAWRLFRYFFRISWFTFGGGWSIVAQMQKDFVDDRQELTAEELLDIVSVGRSLPGTMIGNVAYLFGHRKAGVPGGVLAVLGMITPPVLILAVLTFCYGAVRDNIWVAKALTGIRAAVVPIIAVAALRLRKGSFPEKICYGLFGLAVILSVVWNVNCVLIILLGIFAGFALGKWKEAQAC